MQNTPTDDLENKIRQRIKSSGNPLGMVPDTNHHRGIIPNTPAASAVIAFCLGGVFSFGLYTATSDVFSDLIRVPYQLGLYITAWAFFHWAEFTVTAVWNLEKCNVDCKCYSIHIHMSRAHVLAAYLLENGSNYHVAHIVAILEYLISRHFMPPLKSYPYVSQVGMVMVVLGQVLRSAAMIHASTNFSHAIAFYKRVDHKLVTDGVYRSLSSCDYFAILLTNNLLAGFVILLMPDFFIGQLVPSFSCRTPSVSSSSVSYCGVSFSTVSEVSNCLSNQSWVITASL